MTTRIAFANVLLGLRFVALSLLIVIPIVLGFAAGVLFAIGVRIKVAAIEAFNDGRRLING